MRFAVVALACMSCGRFGFESHTANDGDDARGSIDADANTDDAATSDVAIDTLPATVCGNAICEGVNGEVCGACMADCNTTAVVCGNGACEGAEDGASCAVDCGPLPWPFTQEENDLLVAVNSVRTGGVICPGDSSPRIAAALSMTASMLRGVHEQAWEIAHAQFAQPNLSSCNGRTFVARQSPYGGNGGLLAYSDVGAFASATDVVNLWKMDATNCPLLMTTIPTQATVGVAHDAWHSYVMWFK